MSDPENSDEGEDILKSIRRLVSAEEDEHFRSARPEGAPADRLVLTEDMNVDRDQMPLLMLGEGSAGGNSGPPANTGDPAAADASGATMRREAAARNGDLDEAALRNLVAEIVREELRGELGERITRNIRRLVRREILRAEALRDAK